MTSPYSPEAREALACSSHCRGRSSKGNTIKELRDKLKTDRQREVFDNLIAAGISPEKAYKNAVWQ